MFYLIPLVADGIPLLPMMIVIVTEPNYCGCRFGAGIYSPVSMWWSVLPGFVMKMFGVRQASLMRICAAKSACQASV